MADRWGDADSLISEQDRQRIFAAVDPAEGLPDGLAVNVEGFIWSARWDGWQVCRYDPDGRIDKVIQLPVPLVTSLAFGGRNLDLMFITTARLGLSPDQLRAAPLSGGLFVADAGVAGLPVGRFRA